MSEWQEEDLLGSVFIDVRVSQPSKPPPKPPPPTPPRRRLPIAAGIGCLAIIGTVGLCLVVLLLGGRSTGQGVQVVPTTVELAAARASTSTPTSTLKARATQTPSTPLSTPTASPTPIQLPSPHPGVEITMSYDPSAGPKGQILLDILAAGEAVDASFSLRHAVVDFTGELRVDDDYLGSISTGRDEDRLFNRDYEPGDYAVRFDAGIGPYLGLGPVFVQKQPQTTTLVHVNLGVLEVGALFEGEAISEASTDIYHQGLDITGNAVRVTLDNNVRFTREQTDSRGIVEFLLAEGTYIVSMRYGRFDAEVFDVFIEAGERKRVILTVR